MCRWFTHYKNQCLLSLSLARASWSTPRHHHVAIGRRRTHVGGGRAVRIVRVNRDGPTNGLAQGSIFSATMAWCFGGRCSFFLLSQSRNRKHRLVSCGSAIAGMENDGTYLRRPKWIILTYRQWWDRIAGIAMTGVKVSTKAKQPKGDSAEWERRMLRKYSLDSNAF